jgi:hypothetical protein
MVLSMIRGGAGGGAGGSQCDCMNAAVLQGFTRHCVTRRRAERALVVGGTNEHRFRRRLHAIGRGGAGCEASRAARQGCDVSERRHGELTDGSWCRSRKRRCSARVSRSARLWRHRRRPGRVPEFNQTRSCSGVSYAERRHLTVGDSIELVTPLGVRPFTIRAYSIHKERLVCSRVRLVVRTSSRPQPRLPQGRSRKSVSNVLTSSNDVSGGPFASRSRPFFPRESEWR